MILGTLEKKLNLSFLLHICFFMDNHSKYIENVIKSITEAIYRNMTKQKKKNGLRKIDKENIEKKKRKKKLMLVCYSRKQRNQKRRNEIKND